MIPPAWLTYTAAALAVIVAAYSITRTVALRHLPGPADFETDAADAILALAVVAMLVRWMDAIPHVAWIVALNLTGYWFALRLFRNPRSPRAVPGAAAGGDRTAYLLANTAGCAIGVYMLLAGVVPPATGATVTTSHVMVGMNGMPAGSAATKIALPALGMLFVVVLTVYATVALNRVSTMVPGRAGPTPDPLIAGSVARNVRSVVVSASTVDICRIVLALIMAYLIVANLL